MPIDKNLINESYPINYLFDLELTNFDEKIIGIDEAGRGCLAGPVVIAGVIPDYNNPIIGITDSKKLSAKKREQLFSEILDNPNYKYHIAVIPVEVIDSINILNATKKGIMECLTKLHKYYTTAIIDAVKINIPDKKNHSIIKADLKSASVGSASILAKVYRDGLMYELAKTYPGYDLEKNKGYPTKFHREALGKIGITKIHRKSYAPVREILENKMQRRFFE